MIHEAAFYSAVLLCCVCPAACAYTVDVPTAHGVVTGVRKATTFRGRNYCAFYRLPYAARPLGALRYRAPRPPPDRKSKLDATREHHGACAQTHVAHKDAQYGTEDCLYLNVYTPELPKHPNDTAPVLVWFAGLGWTASFSHIYGPDMMMESGVVMVSVTYRVGAFGFLQTNASDANMGLKDILRSLMWVKRNIAKFGGDKSRVTVMGNGSAATLLALLSLTTRGRQYFSKMILHSGGLFSPAAFRNSPEAEALALREQLEKSGVKSFADAETHDILRAAQTIYTTKDVMNNQRPMVPFTPSVEASTPSALIKQTPDRYYKVKKHLNINIPVLIGSNTQEGLGEAIEIIRNPKVLRTLNSFFRFMVPFSDGCSYSYTTKTYADISARIKQFYFNGKLDESSLEKFLKYLNDLIRYPIYRFAKALATNQTPLYVYKFNYNGILNAHKANIIVSSEKKVRGAAAGDELCYLFTCEPYWETYRRLQNETENIHRQFMYSISNMWTNFVKYGNPTPPGQPGLVWLPVTDAQKDLLFISKKTKMIEPQVEEKMYEFWDKLHNDYYSNEHCVKDEL